ncbi:MAG: enoyl-CoA hydratase/isomerase family protein [Myxococcales bacterium]|nr:enoyl-CoA hydratase/isomerase family protein [Myxococcales bacterium]
MTTRDIDLETRHLVATVEDRVLRVRIDRVERRNAMTQSMYRGLKKAAVLADGDPEIDALLVTGTGDWFCAGGDMSGASENAEALALEPDPTDHHPFRHLERCRKVVVCAVNGACHAGGLNIVLFSDVVVAAERARFRAPELLRGIADPHMTARLPLSVGLAAARYLLFTAAELDAHEAASLGLVGKVVADAEFDSHVEWVLEQIRLTGPRARTLVKDDLNRRLPAYDARIFQREIMNPEMVEGFKAFLEKRRPEWPR